MSGKKTYTQTLEELSQEIAELRGALPGPQDITLGEVYRRQGEMLELQREMNGTVKSHSQAIAAIGQWKADHEETHDGLDDEIKYVNRKFNVVGTVEGILASLGIILGFARGGR